MTLDQVLWELKQYLTVDPEEGGTPYAYRFYHPGDLDHDERLDDLQDAPLVEVRAFYSGTYTLTPADDAGRHLAAPKPPEMTDAVPMIVGEQGVAVPAAIKHPIPDEPPLEVLASLAAQPDVDEEKIIAAVPPKQRGRLRKMLVGD